MNPVFTTGDNWRKPVVFGTVKMVDSIYRLNFDLDKKNETITIAGKSILK
jgi:hypothetical protein